MTRSAIVFSPERAGSAAGPDSPFTSKSAAILLSTVSLSTHTKNPARPPNPFIRPAHALPSSCSFEGNESTTNARSVLITALILKSMRYIAHTAKNIAIQLPAPIRLDTSRAQPRSIIAKTQIRQPAIMYGRRRPNRDLERSANAPTRGWTIRPESGPAMKTRDMYDFDRPRSSRNGEATGCQTVFSN